ncbi:glypican-4 [Lepeophtheirus salmonis]|nr:glypican-4-like [Lepeophtheirus salmonis]
MFTQGIYFVSSVLFLSLRYVEPRGERIHCQNVKISLEKERQGIRLSGFSSSLINDVELDYCPRGPSCCSKETEQDLGNWAKTDFVLQMKKHTQKIAAPLKLYASKLEKYIEQLIDHTQKQENDFFIKTYGIFYIKNEEIFDRFWDEIRDYYVRGRTNLVDATYTFFSELYQKMFKVMNSQYVLDDQYMSCVAETMNAVVPFNDIPKHLAMGLRHSMVAIRALSKSLKDALEVAVQLGDAAEPSTWCFKALQTMYTCPACMGVSSVRICQPFCLDVMQSCVSRHLNLQELWDDFINSTVALLDRISGPFDFEAVMKRKDISISDAIMNYQPNVAGVNSKVFEMCGSPKLMKRSVDEPMTSFIFEQPSEDSLSPAYFAQGSQLYRIVEEVREVLNSTKGFWKSLPAKFCNEGNDETFENPPQSDCWNGESLQNPIASHQSIPNFNVNVPSSEHLRNGIPSRDQDNDESALDDDPIPSVFHEKKFRLRSVLNQVKLATGGQDVEWFDQESDFDERFLLNGGGEASGEYGSGDIFDNVMFSGDELDESFSGQDLPDDEESDEDWNNWNPFSTSSTSSPTSSTTEIEVESDASSLLSDCAPFLMVLEVFLNVVILG